VSFAQLRPLRDRDLAKEAGAVYFENVRGKTKDSRQAPKACGIYGCRAKTVFADDDTIARGLIVNSAYESVCGLNFKPPQAIRPEAIGIA
jgi:hypothetical protein